MNKHNFNKQQIFNTIMEGKTVTVVFGTDETANSFLNVFRVFVSRQRKFMSSLEGIDMVGRLSMEYIDKGDCIAVKVKLLQKEEKLFYVIIDDMMDAQDTVDGE